MEHIILSCPDSSQNVIWELAEEFLEDRIQWSKPEIGTIWGCALAKPKNNWGQIDPGAERAYRIVVSESAFLAWKVRCEKRIEHEDEPDWAPSPAEVKRRWYDVINKRIANDRLLTNKRRYGRQAIRSGTVLETWADLIKNVGVLTEEILRQPGVLVGKGTSRHARGIG
ncbi:hypothetical protein AURDEDRAFT_64801 [Auricularia subglabra TFB-10046 SS5]|nr:hypothetical protein AURDEDRAFT_64801 [Auricularia subglabra TFB-10046 SS5]